MSEEKSTQAGQQLEVPNQELDEFAYAAAHDLKTYAAILAGFAELARENPQSTEPLELGEILKVMTLYIHELDSVIDTMKFFGDIYAQEVKVEPLDMATIVRNALDRISDLIQKYQAEVITPNDSYPVVLGISQWVEEVWVTCFETGLKYGGKPPRLEIGFTSQEDNHVKFWVKDNGKLVAIDSIERANIPKYKGPGLDLLLVQRIIEKLNGQVATEVVPGNGTILSFTLPSSD